MYYLILSWSQCIERLADYIESGEYCCPVCYDPLEQCDTLEGVLEHMRRCYSLYKIKHALTDDMIATTRIDTIRTVVEEVEEEIDNYVTKQIFDFDVE